MTRERRYDGPVVIIESNDDPGDMGEPREFAADGVDYLVVPSWGASARSEEVAAILFGAVDDETFDRVMRVLCDPVVDR